MSGRAPIDLAQLRVRLAEARGPRFWRSLEEAMETPGFRAFLEAEFPSAAPMLSEASRRDVLKVMAASLLLGGLAACGQPPEDIVPYVEAPERTIPGIPRFYATAVPFEGYAQPVLGEVHEGRPTRLTGNPDHPAISSSAADLFTQSAVLQLYDPDRSQTIRYGREIATWNDFQAATAKLGADLAASRGAGFRLLTGNVSSPTLLGQIAALQARLPEMRWHVYEPVGNALTDRATTLAFGTPLEVHPRLDRARVVVCLDADPFGPGPRQMSNGRAWSNARRAARQDAEIVHLHVAESAPTLTGATATAWLPVASHRMPALVAEIARHLGLAASPQEALSPPERNWAAARAAALKGAAGRSLLLVGPHQPAEVQALGFRINAALGALGQTIAFTDPIVARPPDGEDSFPALARDMEAGRVRALLVLGGNPAYTAPADVPFGALMDRVPLRIHVGLYDDETAKRCHWHLPEAHWLETWTDARAIDGTVTIAQPLVRPLYGGVSAHQVLATIIGSQSVAPQDIVRATWADRFGADFETGWRRALHDGWIAGTALPERTVTVRETPPIPEAKPARAPLEIVFRPDPSLWDGRFANVAWLQEIPESITKVTWENTVWISPRLAEANKIATGDHVTIGVNGKTVTGPAWVMPGQADETILLHLGYGRTHAGRVGTGAGFDVYPVRASGAPWLAMGATIKRSGGHTDLATTQKHFNIEGYDFIHTVAASELRKPPSPEHANVRNPSLYEPWSYPTEAWAMVIDLDLCIGCNACALACQTENNIPVVGREQVRMGREMHWLRIDRYYEGPLDSPRTHFQPVPCMHCEKAPCEVGCPVNATVHGQDGLNEMIYNRCIGTRTCSSYCPYKVRRFNFLDYTAEGPAPVAAQRNPDVTVRARGVMEKCTYCIQRIAEARITAHKEDRPIRDGEVTTACQAACPTQVIMFGDQNDPKAAVTEAKHSARNYALLEEVNTWPRTTYLAKVTPDREES